MSTVPVVRTERGRDCVQCGRPLLITVLEFFDGSQLIPTGQREGFVDCSNGCVGVIESADVEE